MFAFNTYEIYLAFYFKICDIVYAKIEKMFSLSISKHN